MTPFFTGGSVLGATNRVVRSFFGQAMMCSCCSTETQHCQQNNSFSVFSPKNLEIHEGKVVVLPILVLELIGIINET